MAQLGFLGKQPPLPQLPVTARPAAVYLMRPRAAEQACAEVLIKGLRLDDPTNQQSVNKGIRLQLEY